MKNKLKKYLKSKYFVSKYLFFKKYNKLYKGLDDIVLIYTMGKVGSTSIYESIKQMNIPTLHLHKLNTKYLKNRERFIRLEIFQNKKYPKHLYTDLLWKPQWIKKKIILKQEKIKLITVIREPVSRNISLFFQWIDFTETNDKYRFVSRNNNYPFDIETSKVDLTDLYDVFFNKFVVDSHLEWVKSEMKTVFNIDLSNLDFDKNKDYKILKTKKVELLVLKLENLNISFNCAMKEFINVDVKLLNENKATSKDINKVYKKFKSEIVIPKAYINNLYSSNYMTTFYSEKEIELFKNKWKQN